MAGGVTDPDQNVFVGPNEGADLRGKIIGDSTKSIIGEQHGNLREKLLRGLDEEHLSPMGKRMKKALEEHDKKVLGGVRPGKRMKHGQVRERPVGTAK